MDDSLILDSIDQRDCLLQLGDGVEGVLGDGGSSLLHRGLHRRLRGGVPQPSLTRLTDVLDDGLDIGQFSLLGSYVRQPRVCLRPTGARTLNGGAPGAGIWRTTARL